MKTNSRVFNGRGSRGAGFTLIEITIVLAVIGLLAAIAVPNFMRARDNARLSAIYNNLRILNYAKEQWATQQSLAPGASIGNASILNPYFRGGQLHNVLNETYLPNPVGTPPVAELPANAGLLTFAPGADIPAP